MSDDVLETVRLRRISTKMATEKLATIVLMLCIPNAFLGLTVAFMYSKPEEVRFFATSTDGKLFL